MNANNFKNLTGSKAADVVYPTYSQEKEVFEAANADGMRKFVYDQLSDDLPEFQKPNLSNLFDAQKPLWDMQDAPRHPGL